MRAFAVGRMFRYYYPVAIYAILVRLDVQAPLPAGRPKSGRPAERAELPDRTAAMTRRPRALRSIPSAVASAVRNAYLRRVASQELNVLPMP
jgi:hypothetical protein